MRILMLISLSAFLLTCCGCGGPKIPDELRNLVPVSVTVMNGTQPMAGMMVTLSAKSGQGAYAVNGVTNTAGTEQIQTSRSSFTKKGAPAGTYSVVLAETIVLPAELEPQETDQDLPRAAQAEKSRKVEEFLRKNRLVPSALTTSGSSPVEVVVAQGQNVTLTIDITEYR